MELSSSASNTVSKHRNSPTVSVVIPTLNEERNLPHVFAKLSADVTEVILVDGGSVDRTVAVARELLPGVVVVQQTRTGKEYGRMRSQKRGLRRPDSVIVPQQRTTVEHGLHRAAETMAPAVSRRSYRRDEVGSRTGEIMISRD